MAEKRTASQAGLPLPPAKRLEITPATPFSCLVNYALQRLEIKTIDNLTRAPGNNLVLTLSSATYIFYPQGMPPPPNTTICRIAYDPTFRVSPCPGNPTDKTLARDLYNMLPVATVLPYLKELYYRISTHRFTPAMILSQRQESFRAWLKTYAETLRAAAPAAIAAFQAAYAELPTPVTTITAAELRAALKAAMPYRGAYWPTIDLLGEWSQQYRAAARSRLSSLTPRAPDQSNAFNNNLFSAAIGKAAVMPPTHRAYRTNMASYRLSWDTATTVGELYEELIKNEDVENRTSALMSIRLYYNMDIEQVLTSENILLQQYRAPNDDQIIGSCLNDLDKEIVAWEAK